jgi:hypothetical protein
MRTKLMMYVAMETRKMISQAGAPPSRFRPPPNIPP